MRPQDVETVKISECAHVSVVIDLLIIEESPSQVPHDETTSAGVTPGLPVS